MTTGVFGGSFDPVHDGHISLAKHIVGKGVCDEVILMVSPLNPLKAGRPPVSFADRLEMARLATRGLKAVRPSDFEEHLPLPSYTYRTLTALAEKYPDRRFKLIIGADNWLLFNKWRNPEEIIERFAPIIYPRPGITIDPRELPGNVTYLADAPRNDISSTELRKKMAGPEARCPEMINPEVFRYARERQLYLQDSVN